VIVDLGLVLARYLHYAATTALAGISLFPFYVYGRTEPAALGRWQARLHLPIAAAALLSGILWFAFSAASMSGSLSEAADAEVLWTVIQDTNFGMVWTARMLLAVLILIVTALRFFPMATHLPKITVPILAAALLASLAGTGHTQVEEGWVRTAHILSDAAHLLGAGAWLGGLVPLGYVLASTSSTSSEMWQADRVLLRFSAMGYAAVAVLVGTGLVNSLLLVGSVSGLVNTPYGQTLLVKLSLFAGMLSLAIANRFWLVPSLLASAAERIVWLRRLRNHVLGEQLLGLMILSVVSLLGTMQPAVNR
jgi:putative copper resistance protein D